MRASTFPASVAARRRSARPSPYATGITPCERSQSWFASLAMPSTVAPVRLASWTARDPTPPAAPETATTSPGDSATACTVPYAVAPTTNSAPACSHGTPAGFAVRSCSPTSTYSAWLARLCVKPMTSSPAATPVTPGPASATIPARSLPSPDGKVAGHILSSKPSRIFASPGLMPAALTWTSTSPAAGTGRGTSTTLSTSIPPYSSNRTARIWHLRCRSACLASDPTMRSPPVCPLSIRQPGDDLPGGAVQRRPEALTAPQAHPVRIAAGRGGGPQWPGGVVDLRVRGRGAGVIADELVEQPACGSSAECPGQDGLGVRGIDERSLVQRVGTAFRTAQERGPALHRCSPRGERRPDLRRGH